MKTSELTGFHQHCLKSGYPFISYRMPGEKSPVTIFGKTRFLPPGSLPANEKGFIFAPFDDDFSSLWFKAEMMIAGNEVEEGYFAEMGTDSTAPKSEISLPAETSKDSYLKSIETILSQLRSDGIKKAVLSRVIRIPVDLINEVPLLFRNLQDAYQNAFIYLMYSPETGIWLGATPELLIAKTGQKIATMALAGTRKTGADGDWGLKERNEHNWVLKYIRQKLEESGCTGIEQTQTYTVKAGNVEHLRTDFIALKAGNDLDFLVRNMHPTPAVCGWPTDKAEQIIKETEGYNRRFYTGYLGPVNIDQKTSLFVNLRCMQAIGNEAAIYAGGGITVDSDPEKEWEETTIKSRTLLAEIEKIRNLAD